MGPNKLKSAVTASHRFFHVSVHSLSSFKTSFAWLCEGVLMTQCRCLAVGLMCLCFGRDEEDMERIGVAEMLDVGVSYGQNIGSGTIADKTADGSFTITIIGLLEGAHSTIVTHFLASPHSFVATGGPYLSICILSILAQ